MNTSSNIYIAVVDNDESLCRSVGRLLRAAGMQVVSYLSAEAFLADTKRPNFDCLVLDIQLPGISGIELHSRLIGVGSSVPVIFITAHDSPEIRERAIQTRCAAYLRKTDPGEAVLAAIRQAVHAENDTLGGGP